jgi:hypothetical protein
VNVAVVAACYFAAGGTDPAGIIIDFPAENGLYQCQRCFPAAAARYPLEQV